MNTSAWNRKNTLANFQTDPQAPPVSGIAFLFSAYLIWGLSPVFWKRLSHVSSFELLVHRTVWSLVFLLVIIFAQKRGKELVQIMKSPAHLGILSVSTVILAFNWYLFIWAVNHDQVLQTSLAYYINPLIIVFLGMIFLKERLRRWQGFALVVAVAGVGYYTLFLGQFPWISIAIAISFAVYGLIHKMIQVLPLPGLCIETLLLSIPAIGYLGVMHARGTGAMLNINLETDLLLVGTCLLTGLPLLFFTIGTKRSSLTLVGFLQYLAPSCSFLLAVFYYQEPFSSERMITFVTIWVALGIYTVDSLYYHRNRFSKKF